MKKSETHRIVIIGAGPAGCSCAISLLNAGELDVYIIDNSKGGKFHVGESIPPDMNLLLRQLGIYDSFLKEGHEPCYGSCSYWGSPNRGYNDSMLSPYGHGWHLDRSKFNEFLLEESIKKGAKVISDATYLSSQKLEIGYQIEYQKKEGDKNHIDAHFIVDATGSKGVFATDRGSYKIEGAPLICVGLRFKNKGQSEVSKLTHLESVKHGWWYAARIPGNYMLVTFYTTTTVVKALGLNSLKNFFHLLAEAPNTFNLLSQMEPADKKIRGFNAYSFRLNTVKGTDWLAIGDTATTYDPVTSQGITKATTHGARAAEIIKHYLAGNKEALAQYEKEIKDQYEYYLSSRSYFYNLEKRWPRSSFWNSMQKSEVIQAAQ
ncbi:MAG: NAD(P)/FAD-dependent oxidoreductase [Gilvibacter sp.]